jgi:hypothetical protein
VGRGSPRFGRRPLPRHPGRQSSLRGLGSPAASPGLCRRMHGNRHLGERGGHLAGAATLPKAAAASAGRPRPGSRAAQRNWPWASSPRPPHRPDPRRPAGSQVTAAPTAYPHPGGPGIPWREADARHDLTPANQRRDRCLPGCPGRRSMTGMWATRRHPGNPAGSQLRQRLSQDVFAAAHTPPVWG